MYKRIPLKISLITTVIILLVLVKLGEVAAVDANATSPSILFTPQDDFRRTTHRVLAQLQHHHYQPLNINDAMSSTLLDEYINYLDQGKQLLTATDIQALEKYRYRLDNEINSGKVDIAFAIYNRIHAQRVARINYMLTQIETLEKLDFTVDEGLMIDSDTKPWATNQVALRDQWRKQFKNDVLSLKLSNRDEQDIADVLQRRYVNQRKRINEFTSEDVFAAYMSVFTGIYDPHTTYMAPRASENFDINMRLSLEGIGARLQREDDFTKIVNLVPGGPAQKSGLIKPADRIIAVGQDRNGEMMDVVGWRLEDVVDLIRGPKGSTVRLQLLTSDATGTQVETEVRLIRDTIKLEDKAARKKIITLNENGKDYRIGVIELPTFYLDFDAYHAGNKDFRSSSRDVARLIYELKQENIDGMMIDLRNNGGGSLDEVRIITGLFIEKGPVVQVRRSNGYANIISDRDPSIAYSGPLVVMVNRLSASASEIFAGAIQDSGRGIVVGQRTFGKGTVQVLNDIKPGRVKFTNATFYRISGDSTQHRGVIPDIAFPSYIDEDEIGESAQKHALPWGQIAPANYRLDASIQQLLPALQTQHQQRINDNVEFAYINQRLQLIEENKNKTTLSLNLKQRQRERSTSQAQLLELENNYRKQKQLPPFKSFSELEANNDLDNDKPDALANEAANILLDYMQLNNDVVRKGQAILSTQQTFPVKIAQ